MRFARGAKVEVLSWKDFPSGSWHGAEIINGNGRVYTVRYDHRSEEREEEKVPRKVIRPSPPSIGASERCIPGEVVEVLARNSWKMAMIVKIMKDNRILVRFLGSSHVFEVNTADVRLRLTWQGNRWSIIGKEPKSRTNQRRRSPSSSCSATRITKRTREQTSSTGSCSVTISNVRHYISWNSSDAESFWNPCLEEEDEVSRKRQRTKSEIHSLELHAYRRTMEALHASGPLSWAREALITNLRLSLNISNEEHLAQLRNLITAGTGISIR